ncbi:hypothetical protein JCM18899A_11690 [Nocardioides sp. AN3]
MSTTVDADPLVDRLQLGHLGERARQSDRLGAEVDDHRARLLLHDVTHPIGVMAHEITQRILLDDRLRIGPEGAAGKVSPRTG